MSTSGQRAVDVVPSEKRSEYWTFVRGVATKGTPRSDGACPSCGAPIGALDMAGKCGSCGAKVTSGDFDWVLSRIEQDEVYEAGGRG